MASRFSCPLSIPTASTKKYQSLYEPNGTTWREYYNWQVYVKNFKISDNLYDGSGHLKSTTNLVTNNCVSSGRREVGWRFWINTKNQLTFGYIYWVAATDKFYYSTSTKPNNCTAEGAEYKKATKYYGEYPLSGMTIKQGITYTFTAKRTGNKELTTTLVGDDGSTQSETFTWWAFNDNYSCDMVVGATGCSFEQLKVQGYRYGSNCLYSLDVTPDTWDHKSSSVPVTVESSCGDDVTYSGTMGSAYTLSVCIPTSLGGARAASASGAITWKNGTYNSSTYTWTKMFVAEEELDFPNIGEYVNKGVATTSNVHTNNTNAFFMGYSSQQVKPAGAAGFIPWPIERWDTSPGIMPESNLTIYAAIGPFDLEDLKVDFDNQKHGTKLTITAKSLSDADNWAPILGATIKSRYSDVGSSQWPVASTSVTTSTAAGTAYELLSKQDAQGKYLVTSEISLNDYKKTGHSTLEIVNAAIKKPTLAKRLEYNKQLRNIVTDSVFNNYPDPEGRVNATLVTDAINAGEYKVLFSLKDPYRMSWEGGGTGNIELTWYIDPKPLTFTSWGTTSWEFDGSKHSTVCNFTGVCSGDTCYATYSGNSIKVPGSATVTTTGVSNSNYSLATQTTTIKVTKRVLDLAWSKITKEYDGSVLQPTVVATNGVSGYTVTLSCTPSSKANVGTYTSVASLTGTSATYYELPSVYTREIEITKLIAIIDWGKIVWDFDNAKHTATPVVTNQIAGVCTCITTGATLGPDPDAQICTITSLSNSNYELKAADAQRVLVINEVDESYGNIYYWNGSKWVLVY